MLMLLEWLTAFAWKTKFVSVYKMPDCLVCEQPEVTASVVGVELVCI